MQTTHISIQFDSSTNPDELAEAITLALHEGDVKLLRKLWMRQSVLNVRTLAKRKRTPSRLARIFNH